MNQKTRNKMTALSMVAVISAALFTGCGNREGAEASQSSAVQSDEIMTSGVQSTETEAADAFEHDPVLNELGAETICNEKVKLTIGVAQSLKVEDYETNHYTKMLEEVGNVDIDFVVFPAEGYKEKLQMMITSGEELPDIIMFRQTDAQAMLWGEEGYLLPLEEYFEHSSYYAKQGYERVLENSGLDILDYMTLSDGHIWTFPSYMESLTNPPYARMYIWQPWLDALGMELPTNTDEFYDMLVAFKTQDPNGNGLADEIPLIGCEIRSGDVGSYAWEYLMNAFTPSTSKKSWLVSTDGKLSVSYAQDGWKEGVKYINRLVEEGLYDPISFTQDEKSYLKFLKTTGDHTVGVMVEMTLNRVEQTTKDNWRLIDILKGPDGTASVAYTPDVPSNRAYITSYCEHPEVAFRILDLMCREDFTITARWGIQGEHWDYVSDLDEAEVESMMSAKKGEEVKYDWENVKYAGYPAYIFEHENIWGQIGNTHWQNVNVAFRTAEVAAGYNAAMQRVDGDAVSTPAGEYTVGQYLEDIAEYIPEEPITKIKYLTLDKQIEAEEIQTELNGYVWEKLASWFIGTTDVEEEWDSYLQELESIGLSRYLELSQEGWK